jgi:hypothetical protein
MPPAPEYENDRPWSVEVPVNLALALPRRDIKWVVFDGVFYTFGGVLMVGNTGSDFFTG